MVMNYVDSSNLDSVGYEDNTLYISFNSGSTYAYYGVPENIYHGLMNASSKGSYHAAYIKNCYRYQKL